MSIVELQPEVRITPDEVIESVSLESIEDAQEWLDKQTDVEMVFLKDATAEEYHLVQPQLHAEVRFNWAWNWLYLRKGEPVGYLRAVPFPVGHVTLSHIIGKNVFVMGKLFSEFVKMIQLFDQFDSLVSEVHRDNEVVLRMLQRAAEKENMGPVLTPIIGTHNILLQWGFE